MKKEYNLLIKRSKINSWKDFIKESASKDPWGTAYKVTMEKYRKPEIYHTVKQGSEITENWETTIKEILNTIAPGNDKTTENIEHKKIIEKCRKYQNKNTEQPITIQEIEIALKRTKDKKAPGLDNLNAEIIKQVWASNKEILLTLLNNCFKNEKFPTKWKKAEVITI